MPDTNVQLSKIVAVEPAVKRRAADNLTAAYHSIQVGNLFGGRLRVYKPKDDEGEQLPNETEVVQQKVVDLIAQLQEDVVAYWDVVATKDFGNVASSADLRVGDQVLIEKVPVPYLIFLDKRLTDLRTFVSKLPVLSSDSEWHYDPQASSFRAEPVETIRYKRFPRTLEKAPATVEHPAQVEVWHEDLPVGTWETTALSGAVPVDVRDMLLKRIDTLVIAVKSAREEANTKEVEQVKVAQPVWDFIFGDLHDQVEG